MKQDRFSEEQIIGFLKEVESGVSLASLIRREGFGESTFYRWRQQYSGLSASEAKALNVLRRENAELQRQLGRAHFELEVVKKVLRGKV